MGLKIGLIIVLPILLAEKYNMKNPELIFDLSFFKENPQILYDYYSYVPEFKCYEPTFTHVHWVE